MERAAGIEGAARACSALMFSHARLGLQTTELRSRERWSFRSLLRAGSPLGLPRSDSTLYRCRASSPCAVPCVDSRVVDGGQQRPIAGWRAEAAKNNVSARGDTSQTGRKPGLFRHPMKGPCLQRRCMVVCPVSWQPASATNSLIIREKTGNFLEFGASLALRLRREPRPQCLSARIP